VSTVDRPELPAAAGTAARRYLRLADRLLPDRVVGFYLIGSVALGEFRPRHSDIDVVAVVDRRLDRREVSRLRVLHLAAAVANSGPAVRSGRDGPGTCNGAFVSADDLTRPVTGIRPIASHTGVSFHVGQAFDVNPVQWAILARCGVAVRGAHPATLGLDPEPDRLRQWNLDNLARYWVPWAESARRRPGVTFRLERRWATSWGALGAPRLHHTVATGEVIGKEAAGEYARATFDERWHPVIDEALAYRRDEPIRPHARSWTARRRAEETGEFVLHVAASAAAL
jgi:Nucleotidyltransferase domain